MNRSFWSFGAIATETHSVVTRDAGTQILGVGITRVDRLIIGLLALKLGVLLVIGVRFTERPVARNIPRIASEVLEILHD